MFFLLRCFFWICIVYVNLPAGPGDGVDKGGLVDMARARLVTMARSSAGSVTRDGAAALGAVVTDQGAQWCQAHGEACADAVLASMLAKSSAPASVDTLTPADRTTRWQGARRG